MSYAIKTPDGFGVFKVVLNEDLPADPEDRIPRRVTHADFDVWEVDLSPLDAENVRQDFSVGTPPGWQLVDGVVVPHVIAAPPPTPMVPAAVTRRQLFLALLAMPTPVTRATLRAQLAGNEAALIEFDEAMDFRRNHPLVASLATALGYSSDQIDALFIAASKL